MAFVITLPLLINTKYLWLYPMKQKSDVYEIFVKFKSLVENYFQTKIAWLYTNGGGEYQKLKPFLEKNGISHLFTPPYIPQHNASIECRHRHIVDLTLLHNASMPSPYWAYDLLATTYLSNRMPTSVLSGMSPYQVLFLQVPNYHNLKIFGCLC